MYLAPELVADPRAAGPASDQYALGAIVYESADRPAALRRRRPPAAACDDRGWRSAVRARATARNSRRAGCRRAPGDERGSASCASRRWRICGGPCCRSRGRRPSRSSFAAAGRPSSPAIDPRRRRRARSCARSFRSTSRRAAPGSSRRFRRTRAQASRRRLRSRPRAPRTTPGAPRTTARSAKLTASPPRAKTGAPNPKARRQAKMKASRKARRRRPLPHSSRSPGRPSPASRSSSGGSSWRPGSPSSASRCCLWSGVVARFQSLGWPRRSLRRLPRWRDRSPWRRRRRSRGTAAPSSRRPRVPAPARRPVEKSRDAAGSRGARRGACQPAAPVVETTRSRQHARPRFRPSGAPRRPNGDAPRTTGAGTDGVAASPRSSRPRPRRPVRRERSRPDAQRRSASGLNNHAQGELDENEMGQGRGGGDRGRGGAVRATRSRGDERRAGRSAHSRGGRAARARPDRPRAAAVREGLPDLPNTADGRPARALRARARAVRRGAAPPPRGAGQPGPPVDRQEQADPHAPARHRARRTSASWLSPCRRPGPTSFSTANRSTGRSRACRDPLSRRGPWRWRSAPRGTSRRTRRSRSAADSASSARTCWLPEPAPQVAAATPLEAAPGRDGRGGGPGRAAAAG